MNIGEAVKERILELCSERDISINKLCSMSGVTQSTVNNIIKRNSASLSTVRQDTIHDGQTDTGQTSQNNEQIHI